MTLWKGIVKNLSVLILLAWLSVFGLSTCSMDYVEPPKNTPTILAPYYIEKFSSNTKADGTIVFTWEYVTSNLDTFDCLAISVRSDGSIVSEETITDTATTQFEIQGEVGKIYSYEFTPYSMDGNKGKVYKGTRYIRPSSLVMSLPTLEITTVDYIWPDCDYVTHPNGSVGEGITNNNYVYMNAVLYDTDRDEVLYSTITKDKDRIKIRGNTSAYGDKKPYKIKLDKKVDLLAPLTGRTGDHFKDKEWLLMTNGTTLNNAIGFTVNNVMGIEYSPAYAYVELIVNGDYRGSYMIVESVKEGNIDKTTGEQSRCQVDEDSGYVFEHDPYWWNEDVYFRTGTLKKAYTFKYPDPDEITDVQIAYIKNRMDAFEKALVRDDESYQDHIDVETFASWTMVHEYLGAYDAAGSNQYLMLRNSDPQTKIEMTTTWDFDGMMPFSQIGQRANIHSIDFFLTRRLLSKDSFHTLCSDKYRATKDKVLDEINSVLNALPADAINSARSNDAIRWERSGYATVESQQQTVNDWITQRFRYLDSEYGS